MDAAGGDRIDDSARHYQLRFNPNSVAPPEMKLLELSIKEDGYTQPIVGFDNGANIEQVVFGDNEIEVVDGFHRHRVGKECKEITDRVHGYLPIISINQDRKVSM